MQFVLFEVRRRVTLLILSNIADLIISLQDSIKKFFVLTFDTKYSYIWG